MIKVKLLNDGGFKGLDNLDFDTVFEAVPYHTTGADITITSLIAAGASPDLAVLNRADATNDTLYFGNGTGFCELEYEVIDG